MAYEYEIKIPMWLEDGRWLNMNVDDKVLDELQEVYRKAKMFDKIVDIEDDFFRYHGFSPRVEEYAEEVEDIISGYKEEE